MNIWETPSKVSKNEWIERMEELMNEIDEDTWLSIEIKIMNISY